MLNFKKPLYVLSLVALTTQVLMAAPASKPPVATGLTLLLDASDIDANGTIDPNLKGIVDINGDLNFWQNKSILSGGHTTPDNNFFPAEPSKKPKVLSFHLNGKATISFKQSGLVNSNIAVIPTNSNYTKFVVFKVNDPSQSNNLISSDATGLWMGQAVNKDKQGVLKSWHNDGTTSVGVNFLTDKNSKVLDTKDYHIASTRYAKGAVEVPPLAAPLPNVLRMDSVEIDFNNTVVNHVESFISIGSIRKDDGLDGEIAEAIVYNRALSNVEITQIEEYLKKKWGGFKENKITSFVIESAKKEKGKTIKLTGEASSKLAVIFSSATPSICKITGTKFDTVQLLAIGKCTVDAGVVGNTTYRDAETIRKNFNVVAVPVPTTPTPTPNSGGGGGGSTTPVGLILLGLMAIVRRRSLVR